MEKNILIVSYKLRPIAVLLALASCAKGPSARIKYAEGFNSENYPHETGFVVAEQVVNGATVMNDLFQQHMDRVDHCKRIGRYEDIEYNMNLASAIVKTYKPLIDSPFFKVTSLCLNPDTSHHSVYYFRRDSLIKEIHYK